MKAKVYVTLKQSVLDPQGKAIHHTAELLGFEGIKDIRQSKCFEVVLDPSLSEKQAKDMVEKMAKDILANPIIEDYKVVISVW